MDLARLSLNQMTVRNLAVPDVVDLCTRHGIGSIGLWREPVARTGLQESVRVVRDAGLHVSSLCRGGFFAAQETLDDNRRAVEEAAELGADLLVLVCGGMAGHTLERARKFVAESIAALAPFAADHRVRLGIEPLHPMYAASRSVIVTLAQALAITKEIGAENVGVVIDVYHVWWDPALYQQIADAPGRIFGLHLCDWLDPLPDFVNGRGLMGDGVADVRGIREAVEASGYRGPIEVEIFNEQLWATPADDVVELIKVRCQEVV